MADVMVFHLLSFLQRFSRKKRHKTPIFTT